MDQQIGNVAITVLVGTGDEQLPGRIAEVDLAAAGGGQLRCNRGDGEQCEDRQGERRGQLAKRLVVSFY